MATITLQGKPVQTVGDLPVVGSQASDFSLTKIDLSELTLKECLGNTMVLNIFPSVDTPTCSMAFMRFNTLAGEFNDTLILCVSADLPFALKRFCAASTQHNVIPLSVFRHPDFGLNYGVTIIDGPLRGLLSRAVVVLDGNGKVKYTQQVAEIAHEPNYDAVLSVLKK